MKRLMTLFFALALLFSALPVSVSAENTDLKDVDIFLSDCPEHGNVERVAYTTTQYCYSGQPQTTKHMTVYTPYGYDENSQYDLLVIIPGSGQTDEYTFGHYPFSGSKSTLENVIDNLIYYQYCRPMVVVCISWSINDDVKDMDITFDWNQCKQEIKNNILPFLVENYALYAENGSYEELVRNREHVFILGSSYGAIMLNGAVFSECLDVAYKFCSCSSPRVGMEDVAEQIEESQYDVGFYLNTYGTSDTYNGTSKNVYKELLAGTDKLVDHENAMAVAMQGESHTLSLMVKSIAMFMQCI